MKNTLLEKLFPYFTDSTPGCSVGVMQGDRVLMQESYGMADLEDNILITSDTAFRLASLTKPFTAMAIIILYEKGELSFDDKLIKFFPGFSAYGRNITIRQLLSHTSGLPDHEKPLYKKISLYREPTIYDSLKILKEQKRLLFTSGDKYQYSDAGFVMLALIIEKVSGQRYGDFLQENIFNALGMANTIVFDEKKPVIENRAFGYRKVAGTYELFDYDPLNYIVGDEGIYSTVRDLFKWKKAWELPILVKKETLNQALNIQKLNNGNNSKCGFSWFIEDIKNKRYIYHDGFWVGFTNIMLTQCNTDTSVILLSNTTQFSTERKRINKALQILAKL